jgi:vanillate O-demethylase ferredoxin subunit
MSEANLSIQTLKVEAIDSLSPHIKQFRLRALDGAVLPQFEPGDHIQVKVVLGEGKTDWRHYSLIHLTPIGVGSGAPDSYRIAVNLEPEGRGGSRFMHSQLAVGDRLEVRGPFHEFPLDTSAPRVVLLAGGIGITPLAGMAAHLVAQGRAVTLHYAGRNPESMAFVADLKPWLGESLRCHADSVAGKRINLDAVLDDCGHADPLYVCGPRAMLDSVLQASRARGWTEGRVHFELFSAAQPAGAAAFEVHLHQSGRCFSVPAHQSILDVLIEQGCDPLFDCRRGECGVCVVPVLDGRPDHRDYALTEREKADGKLIQICVSRSHSPRLVLDV